MIRLCTLNIRQGGGKRADSLVSYLVHEAADIVILTEFRENPAGNRIRDQLAQAGFAFWESSHPAPRMNGVAVAAKLPFTALAHPSEGLQDQECRWLECFFSGFGLIANYFPHGKPKLVYWQWFISQAQKRAEAPFILAGDFNTGKHYIDEVGATFYGPKYMTAMEADGWIDAWRFLNPDKLEYTWSSNRGGEFRLDYFWLSRPMSGWLHGACHVHLPRTSGITDHSALCIDLNPLPEVPS